MPTADQPGITAIQALETTTSSQEAKHNMLLTDIELLLITLLRTRGSEAMGERFLLELLRISK